METISTAIHSGSPQGDQLRREPKGSDDAVGDIGQQRGGGTTHAAAVFEGPGPR